MVNINTANPHLLLGPVFPAPIHLNTNPTFQSATSLLSSQLLDTLTQGSGPLGSVTANASSVSITVVSTAQEDPIFDFHFTPKCRNISACGTGKVDKDSIFRIGSISKLFTVYALLVNNGFAHWERPVTDYLPELQQSSQLLENNSSVESVDWRTVTVGSLANQLSGIGRDYNVADLSTFSLPWTELGFPQLAPDQNPKCGGGEMERPCQREEYFQGFLRRHPVFAPQSTPVYSNTAFRILSYVLEAIASDGFESIMQKDVFQPLGLNHTSVSKPSNDSKAVIPQGDSMWAFDIGDEAPSGGIYSSSSDLANLARHIMLNTQLTPPVTRRWLKPAAHTSALTLSVGAPWEIWRTKSNITDGRTIDLFTKGGSIGLYNSNLILIPDFHIAIAITTAGPDSKAVNVVSEMLVQTLIPVLERAARDEAARSFAGLYASDNASSSSISLFVDDDPGLVIKKWMSNGSDLLATAAGYAEATNGGQIRSVRLYPNGLSEQATSGNEVAFRALFDTEVNAGPGPRVFDQNLNIWAKVDQVTYGRVGVDDFVFGVDGAGIATYVEPRVLGVRLRRLQS